ncbi:hypothetical protein BG006_006740, partial [Podila minutissima]
RGQQPRATSRESWLWRALSFIGHKCTTQENRCDSNVETSKLKIRFSPYPGYRSRILAPQAANRIPLGEFNLSSTTIEKVWWIVLLVGES